MKHLANKSEKRGRTINSMKIVPLGFVPYGCLNNKEYYKCQIEDLSMYKNHPDGLDTYSQVWLSEMSKSEIKDFNENYIYAIELQSKTAIVCLIKHYNTIKDKITLSFANPEFKDRLISVEDINRLFVMEVMSKGCKNSMLEE